MKTPAVPDAVDEKHEYDGENDGSEVGYQKPSNRNDEYLIL